MKVYLGLNISELSVHGWLDKSNLTKESCLQLKERQGGCLDKISSSRFALRALLLPTTRTTSSVFLTAPHLGTLSRTGLPSRAGLNLSQSNSRVSGLCLSMSYKIATGTLERKSDFFFCAQFGKSINRSIFL